MSLRLHHEPESSSCLLEVSSAVVPSPEQRRGSVTRAAPWFRHQSSAVVPSPEQRRGSVTRAAPWFRHQSSAVVPSPEQRRGSVTRAAPWFRHQSSAVVPSPEQRCRSAQTSQSNVQKVNFQNAGIQEASRVNRSFGVLRTSRRNSCPAQSPSHTANRVL
ncbi:hypothetical protein CesoFtcFv8_025661 [Champsocephalus esox]|uniref:Uncharacterized protein n=1 Tax=Champsocephalus esox TaxID=159716 RepID=A0AAN8GDD4_9TELE|nr:hypothetical protein CesoFtcFv8_025661 [Champsocephalus esox]